MNNIKAIFIKQMTSMLRMPTLIGSGLFFALVAFVMMFFFDRAERECAYPDIDVCVPAHVCDYCMQNNPLHSLPNLSAAGLFTVMFTGMMLIGSASGLVQEDKTTHNLRFMTMAGMKPHQYLIGTGTALMLVAVAILFLFAMVGRHFGMDTLRFMAITSSGALVAITFGIAGGLSKAPYIVGTLSMLLGMGPMFSQFSEQVARVLHFTFTQQVNLAVYHLPEEGLQQRPFLVMLVTLLVILVAFVWMHRKGDMRW